MLIKLIRGMCTQFQVDIFKNDRVVIVTHKLSKTDTYHVIYHAFPTFIS